MCRVMEKAIDGFGKVHCSIQLLIKTICISYNIFIENFQTLRELLSNEKYSTSILGKCLNSINTD